MKRLVALLFGIILLAGCGTDELEKFTDKFNSNAETRNVDKLDIEEFEGIEIEDGRGWQVLYDSSEYTIDAKYEDGKNLSGYYLVIDSSEPFEDMKGNGYDVGKTIAETLELDVNMYEREYETGLTQTSHSYTDENYIVSFTNPGKDGLTSVGMIINFDKR